MLRTDDGHRWEPTLYMPMSSSYARTLYDDGAMLMTGDTRPAEFGLTRSGDEVHVRRSGFGVDINTDAMPLDVLAQRLEPGSIVTDLQAEQALRNEAARVAGARMGGGNPEPSEPMPLSVSRATPQHRWSRVADLVVGALFVGCLIGWALGKLA